MPFGRPKSDVRVRTLAINGSGGAWVSLNPPYPIVGFTIKEATGLAYRISTNGGTTSIKKDGTVEWFEDDLLFAQKGTQLVARADGAGAASLEITEWL